MILVTGASGFVGSALACELARRGQAVRAAARVAPVGLPVEIQATIMPDLGADGDWRPLLSGIDCIVHCAARVHVMRETAADAQAAYRRANVEGTLRLARQAAECSVRRLVLVSSIKVNGEQTAPGHPFTAVDRPQPVDPYGVSKWESEQALLALSRETGLDVVIVRPPLVYGPGVKANFLVMLRWLARGTPLPLGAVVHNRRSLVGLDNLCDLLIMCCTAPAARGQTFLAADGEDMSTTGLMQRMGAALGRPARLLPVSPALLQGGAALLGRKGVAQRLLGSLQLDITHTRATLGWTPPVTVDEGLRRVARAYRAGIVRDTGRT